MGKLWILMVQWKKISKNKAVFNTTSNKKLKNRIKILNLMKNNVGNRKILI